MDHSHASSDTPCLRVLVDADACPVRAEIAHAARKFGAEALYFANTAQLFDAGPSGRVVEVGDGRDSADFAMVTECREGDIAVTDDLGLASMLLPKGAAVLSSRGRQFSADEMPLLLGQRHAAKKARRAGKRTRGPAPLTLANRQRFIRTLADLLHERKHA